MSVEFFTSYAQLINLSDDAPANTFYSTEDYAELHSLGPSLPKLILPFPAVSSAPEESSKTSITLKSIRPPYKFNVVLADIDSSNTIYKVKQQLIETVDTLKLVQCNPSNLKFMLKSKILSDTTLVSALDEGVSITVMVLAPAKPVQTPVAAEDDIEVCAEISPETWSAILSLLEKDLGPSALDTLNKFKASV